MHIDSITPVITGKGQMINTISKLILQVLKHYPDLVINVYEW